MKNSKILKCLSILAFLSCTVSLASCGPVDTPSGETPATSENGSTENGGTVETGIIASVQALTDEIVLKDGSLGVSIKDYYKINPTKGNSLTSAQQRCTYESANEKICTFSSNGRLTPKGIGSTTVTITSKTDTTKSCTIKVTVKDVFFDQSLSMFDPRDDMSKEHPDDEGIVRTESKVTADLVVKGVVGTKWYAECSYVLNSVGNGEYYPKLGIFAHTSNYSNPTDNKFYYFMNAWIGETQANSTWTDFGVCEVQNSTNWAWNTGITNETARHNDACFSSDTVLTYGTEFTLGLLRDGINFHLFYNGTYKCSVKVLESLFADVTGAPVPSYVGFFQFNSDVTFSKYTNTTADETVVNEKLAAIEGSINFNENWAAD